MVAAAEIPLSFLRLTANSADAGIGARVVDVSGEARALRNCLL